MSKCQKCKEHRGTAQRGRPKHLQITPLFGLNEDRQIAVMVQKRQRTSGYGPTGTLATHTENKSGKKHENAKKCKKMHQKMQEKFKNCKIKYKKYKKNTQRMREIQQMQKTKQKNQINTKCKAANQKM